VRNRAGTDFARCVSDQNMIKYDMRCLKLRIYEFYHICNAFILQAVATRVSRWFSPAHRQQVLL